MTGDMRQAIRREIAAIEAFDAREARDIGRALAWIDSGAELCRREKPATPPRHLVSYFALVEEDWILLVDHINAQLWLPSGGHVEPGESPAECVAREVHEELGIAADFLHPAPIFLTETETVGLTAGHSDISLWFALRGRKDQALDFDASEFHAIRWFHRDALPLDRMEPNLLRFMAKLQRLG
jgi:8-oxo-dGTP diphosphatase